MKKLAFVLLLIFISSCKQEEPKEFSLEGKTQGMKDGTVLYLDADDSILDSAKIQNNSFSFSTALPESPTQVILRTKDFSEYRFLWLEDSSMTFDASGSDFRNALVSGSYEENLSQELNAKIDSLPRSKQLELTREFVKDHPESIHSSYILSVYSSTWGKEKSIELFENFSEENKKNQYGKKIANFIELNQDLKIGDRYADFEMEDTTGEMRKLSGFENKVVLLEFWAAWCGPCREENPNLVKTYKNFHPKGFEIFAVSLDSDKDFWLKAINDDGLVWDHVSDLKGNENKAALIYGLNGIPDNFLIAENGKIVGRNLRGEELDKKLQEILR
ncbi:AhpC/TSA family protein [Gramella sp. GC03-9]|uniref:AhpC/TSA family protein n=1 Tax=Christiangramia oceanisediminis TaxID=2920386 RepID=A0A9X2KW29_9FLAO|nr:TlpA disulfide reductase family protein [Gramella oceanisediminis]MCP9198854.1 AhpC/TSA family protein [Gramella oceanisediminis]